MNSFLAEAVPVRRTAPGGYAVGLVAPDHATTKRLLRALRGASFHVESVAYTLGELAIESREFELDAIVLHSGRDLTQLPATIAEFRRRAAGVSIVVVT